MLNVWVFLNHSNEDKTMVITLKKKLQKYGIDVFLTYDDVKGSTKWLESLMNNFKCIIN